MNKIELSANKIDASISIGMYFEELDGRSVFILALVGDKAALVDLADGIEWSDPVEVAFHGKIDAHEWEEISGGNDFRRITKPFTVTPDNS